MKKSHLIISILLASNVALAKGDNNNPIPITPLSADKILNHCLKKNGRDCDTLIKRGMQDAWRIVNNTQQNLQHYKYYKNSNLPRFSDLVETQDSMVFQTFSTVDNLNNNDFMCDGNNKKLILTNNGDTTINTLLF